MYAHFKGTIDNKMADRIILDVNNIGYEIYMPESEILSLENDSKEVKIYTYLNVREDDMKLFGFTSFKKLEFFKKLISVSGVGPKVALGIISNIDVSDMCVAIATDNIATLKSIPGIGPKMAQKIIFELKDKVIKDQMIGITEKRDIKSKVNPNEIEAITALQVLGYSQNQIKDIISKLDISGNTVEEIIRKVLKEVQNI
ncbi:MAG: Holliday junction branch migration protein RuvA [Clostridia bacterium]|nr:Holliday junction branch migration protein RuvA [Clostridia bacterium]